MAERERRRLNLGCLLIAAAAVFAGGGLFSISTIDDGVTITVSDKERIGGNDRSKYLVWSEEGETFKNTDSIFVGKLASSDLQSKLKEGKTYTCKVAGKRIHIFSEYRNLIDCEPEK